MNESLGVSLRKEIAQAGIPGSTLVINEKEIIIERSSLNYEHRAYNRRCDGLPVGYWLVVLSMGRLLGCTFTEFHMICFYESHFG